MQKLSLAERVELVDEKLGSVQKDIRKLQKSVDVLVEQAAKMEEMNLEGKLKNLENLSEFLPAMQKGIVAINELADEKRKAEELATQFKSSLDNEILPGIRSMMSGQFFSDIEEQAPPSSFLTSGSLLQYGEDSDDEDIKQKNKDSLDKKPKIEEIDLKE